MTRLSSLLLLSLLAACQGPTVVLVSLTGALSEAVLARATLTLDGARLQRQEEFPGPPPRFALRFPAGTTGSLDLLVEGIDRDGCVSAQGQGRLQLDGEALLELQAPMSPRAPRRCADRALVLPGQGAVELISVAIHPAGDVVVAGAFMDRLLLPGSEIVSAGGQDGLVARLSPDGAPRWVRPLGGLGADKIRAMAVDPARGDIYITGFYTGAQGICGSGPTGKDDQDAFLARLTPDGECAWGVRLGSEGQDEGHAVAVDRTGAVVLTGTFHGVLTLDDRTAMPPTLLPGPDGSSVFLTRHDPQGRLVSYVRVHLPDADTADTADGVATDGSGNIYLSGDARNQYGGKDTFVTCYTSALARCPKHLRLPSLGRYLQNTGTRVLVDQAGDLLVSGLFEGRIDFGGQVLENLEQGVADAYLMKLNGRDLRLLWLQGMGGVGEDAIWGLAQAPSGDIVICGYSQTFSLFGTGRTLKVEGELDIFALRLGADGQPRWLRGLGGLDRDLCWGAAVDGQGRTWLAGNFFGDASFVDGQSGQGKTGESAGLVLRLP